MARLAIIGNAAGGKSGPARGLGEALGLSVHAPDSILWQPGWARTRAAEFRALHQRLIEGEKWIIDGFDPSLINAVNQHRAGRNIFRIRSVKELEAFRRSVCTQPLTT